MDSDDGKVDDQCSGRTCPFVSCIEDVDGRDALMFASANWLAQPAVGRQAHHSLHPCHGVFDSVLSTLVPFADPVAAGLVLRPLPGISSLGFAGYWTRFRPTHDRGSLHRCRYAATRTDWDRSHSVRLFL